MQNFRMGIGGKRISMEIAPTPYHAFKRAMEELGYPSYVPNPRTDNDALTTAGKNKFGGRNRLIASKGGRGKKKSVGIDLVDVQRQQDAFNGYNPKLRAKVVGTNGTTQVVVEDSGGDNDALSQELTEEFLATKAILSGSAIKTKLKALMGERMHAIHGLGGSYIPEADVPAWDLVAERLFGKYDEQTGVLLQEGVCGGEYEVTRADLDADSVRSIRKRLAEEIQKRSDKIIDDVSQKDLNTDRLQVRCDESQELLDLISVYEEELKLTLDDLRGIADKAKRMSFAAFALEMMS